MVDSQQDQALDRILVIRLSSLGDVVLTAPALRALRSRFPTSRIDFLTSKPYVDLASALPGVDRVLEFDKRGGLKELLRWQFRLLRTRYSIIVDLQNSSRSACWRALAFPVIWVKARRYRLRRFLLIHLRKNLYPCILPVPVRYLAAVDSLGCGDDGGGLELRVPEDIARQTHEELEGSEATGERAIILAPGARHATKRWPVENWADLARTLLSRDYQVILVGDRADEPLIEAIVRDVTDKGVRSFINQPLLKVAALLQFGACLISNDSGPMHLATAVGAPVVALFGPTVEEFGFFPFRARSEVIQRDLPCRPCSAMGSEQCPEDHFRCMRDITVAEVLSATERLISHPEMVSVMSNP
jgi:heptosyltransferase-2